jgi:vacuolar-type H+-ATPase subunit I/STV1
LIETRTKLTQARTKLAETRTHLAYIDNHTKAEREELRQQLESARYELSVLRDELVPQVDHFKTKVSEHQQTIQSLQQQIDNRTQQHQTQLHEVKEELHEANEIAEMRAAMKHIATMEYVKGTKEMFMNEKKQLTDEIERLRKALDQGLCVSLLFLESCLTLNFSLCCTLTANSTNPTTDISEDEKDVKDLIIDLAWKRETRTQRKGREALERILARNKRRRLTLRAVTSNT